MELGWVRSRIIGNRGEEMVRLIWNDLGLCSTGVGCKIQEYFDWALVAVFVLWS